MDTTTTTSTPPPPPTPLPCMHSVYAFLFITLWELLSIILFGKSKVIAFHKINVYQSIKINEPFRKNTKKEITKVLLHIFTKFRSVCCKKIKAEFVYLSTIKKSFLTLSRLKLKISFRNRLKLMFTLTNQK